MTQARSHPVWHETSATIRHGGRQRVLLVAELHHGILLRPKGTRQILTLPIESAWMRACQIEADRIRSAKLAKRKGGGQ